MLKYYLFILLLLPFKLWSQDTNAEKIIHVFVALCDNDNQGIVPVPSVLGDGQDPSKNLYWGALYGVKTHFKNSNEWRLIKIIDSKNPIILERLLFKHSSSNTFMLADAYDGRFIKQTTIDFLKASGGDEIQTLEIDDKLLKFGGGSGLVAYIGHDGLMEFDLDETFSSCEPYKDAIILACVSQHYFSPYLSKTGANPLVWTTNLMAPEAYTLKASVKGWIYGETDLEIRERAAQAYHKYQKCGINGARNLLITGY